MFYTYALKNRRSGSWYIGYTADITQRMSQHQKKKPEYTLLYFETYLDSGTARERERALKLFGGAFRALKKRLGEESNISPRMRERDE